MFAYFSGGGGVVAKSECVATIPRGWKVLV